MEKLKAHSNQLFANIIDTQQRISTDLTGRFPVTSNWVNEYLFVLYEYDSNSILVCPMKAITNKEFIRVFKYLMRTELKGD